MADGRYGRSYPCSSLIHADPWSPPAFSGGPYVDASLLIAAGAYGSSGLVDSLLFLLPVWSGENVINGLPLTPQSPVGYLMRSRGQRATYRHEGGNITLEIAKAAEAFGIFHLFQPRFL
jgi:hypothetical protein